MEKQKKRNVRLWVWWNNDWSKITIPPSGNVTLWQGGPTDEGWSSRAEVYYQEGDAVICEITTDGRDCDGRLSTAADYLCPLDSIQNRPITGKDGSVIAYAPAWVRESASQRDYAAEAAGY